jgi:hypothetical protein
MEDGGGLSPTDALGTGTGKRPVLAGERTGRFDVQTWVVNQV